jgi:hypothetical protein
MHGSEDSHARALWAVGTALGGRGTKGHRNLCGLLFQRGLSPVGRFSSPRAWAFAILAIHEYLRSFSGDRVVGQMRDVLTNMLADLFRANSTPDWQWFERIVTYDNAKLSHAMILSGHWTSQPEILDIGVALAALAAQGADGGGRPLRADRLQRLLDAGRRAGAIRSAAARGARDGLRLSRGVRGDARPFWRRAARLCFEWFLGRNDLGLPLYDPTTGGCRDALLQDHINQNQGAESSLAFYLSFAELTRAEAASHFASHSSCAA